MSTSTLLSACIAFVFLGITSSAPLGVQHSELLSESTNIKDIGPFENKQNVRLIKVNQEQYAPNEANERGNQPEILTKSYIQKRQAQPEENATYDLESEEDSSEHFANKRITQMRTNPEDMGFKSRPGFRSWGGKRSKFTNWGGKRNAFSRWGGKRSKFNNWGGKRSENEVLNLYDSDMGKIFAEEPAAAHSEGKTYGFQKRDPEYPAPYEQEGNPLEKYLDYDFLKKDEFQTWAGKRAEKPVGPAVVYNKFSKWAGKRKFSNWAGKRASLFPDRSEDMSANWILRNRANSILNMMKNEENAGKTVAVESSPFRDEAGNEKAKIYVLEESR